MSSLSTFQAWFDDMERRYAACYDDYKELLHEAWEAGASSERENHMNEGANRVVNL